MSSSSTSQQRQTLRVLACCAIGFICFLGAYMRIPVLPLLAGIGLAVCAPLP